MGGLGIKNVEIMNVALLGKWKWRIFTDKKAVWRNILKSRYIKPESKILIGDISVVAKLDSIWWRDLLISENYVNLRENHFAGSVNVCVGNGKDTPFWYAKWGGEQSLMEAYPEIPAEAINDKVTVAESGPWIEAGWS